ncbi:MAG: glycosyltransferase family 4 protein [Candidatus Endonucleobacter sp. (ex Gigantidas childressi)]|nr:glycosyltransferase family 4 protein [Candidatus Endonucleobacter sp. (ex Gigantidas childressi)]
MKLLIIINSLDAGGAERVCANLANYWADKGWQITLVTIGGREKDFYQLHSDVQRICLYLDTKNHSLLAVVKNTYQCIQALRKVFKQQQPDVALSIGYVLNVLSTLAGVGLNISVIGSEHSHPPMEIESREKARGKVQAKVMAWLRRHGYSYLDAVTALTKETARWIKAKTNAQYVSIIPNAVTYPIATCPPIVSPDMATNKSFNLLAVGRLAYPKGFDRLLLAFAELAPRFPDWHLTILGEGDCRGSLEQLRTELLLEQRVSFPGVVGNLGEWYEAADLYVQSSLFEGFPNTLIEAMAYGLPVVSVDCDTGPRDIIHDKVDGLLVPQNNQEALVEALAFLMSDKALRQQYAARAIEVRERFSMEKIAGMWEQLFVQVSNKLE